MQPVGVRDYHSVGGEQNVPGRGDLGRRIHRVRDPDQCFNFYISTLAGATAFFIVIIVVHHLVTGRVLFNL